MSSRETDLERMRREARGDVQSVRDRYRTQWPGKQRLPTVPVYYPGARGDLQLPVGLHLLVAPGGGGKTLTALGLYTWLSMMNLPAVYDYAWEPLSPRPVTGMSLDKHEQMLKDAAKQLSPKPFTLETPAIECRGYHVVDSISLALRMLPNVATMAESLGDQAYRGGLKPADLCGAAVHNAYACAMGVVLIATVNSEMLPIAADLKGVVMGINRIGSPGVIGGDDRSTRTERPLIVPFEAMDMASRSIGYGPYKGVGSSAPTRGRV